MMLVFEYPYIYSIKIYNNQHYMQPISSFEQQDDSPHVIYQGPQKIPKFWRAVLYLTIAFTFFATIANWRTYVWLVLGIDSTKHKKISLDDIQESNNQGKDVQWGWEQKFTFDDLKSIQKQSVDFIKQTSSVWNKTTRRISMSSPNPPQNSLTILTYQLQSASQQSPSYNCLLTNAVTSLTDVAIDSAVSVLTDSKSKYAKYFVIADSADYKVKDKWQNFVDQISNKGVKGKVQVRSFVTVDTNYQWLLNPAKQCLTITYLSHSIKINTPSSLHSLLENSLRYQSALPQKSVLFTPTALASSDRTIMLTNLQTANLINITNKQINEIIIIFDAAYLRVITPVNFAYYARYTIEDIIIRPILAIAQAPKGSIMPKGTGLNAAKGQPFHTVVQDLLKWGNNIQYSLVQPIQQKHQSRQRIPNTASDICFVSFPSYTTQSNIPQIQQYLKSVTQIPQSKNSTIILFIHYLHPPNQVLFTAFDMIMEYVRKGFMNIRVRIRENSVVSSLAVYQAAYMYCPQSSLMVTSRRNIRFQPHFLQTLLPSITYQNHVYFTKLMMPQFVTQSPNKTYDLPKILHYYSNKFRNQLTYYSQYFMHLQIFKSDLFKMMYFWILKSAQLQFYQTEASYVIPLLQMTRLQVGIMKDTRPGYVLYTQRQISDKQKLQMNNIKLYYEWGQITYNKLRPIPHNCLQNTAFRKDAPQKIPRIIHQVWLGQTPITAFQQKLHKTLIQTNPQFSIKLWRDNNITAQQFPLTYSLIARSLQYQKHSKRSYTAPIVSLIRYQLLYHYGGIYIDFKTEGKKSLRPFLKYQLFFIDVDYDQQHYVYPKNVGNGIMGAIKHNYHMKLVLTQLINQDKFKYQAHDFPKIVGGFILRQVLTDTELFTQVGFGFQLFSQKPGSNKPNLCTLSQQPTLQNNQQKYEVEDYKTGRKFTVVLPCQAYQQAYLIMYKVLAGTWRPKAESPGIHK